MLLVQAAHTYTCPHPHMHNLVHLSLYLSFIPSLNLPSPHTFAIQPRARCTFVIRDDPIFVVPLSVFCACLEFKFSCACGICSPRMLLLHTPVDAVAAVVTVVVAKFVI